MTPALSKTIARAIKKCIDRFDREKHLHEVFARNIAEAIRDDPRFINTIYTIKRRVKSNDSLREKLNRKSLEGDEFREMLLSDKVSLYNLVTDLAGVRVIHLHFSQLKILHPSLMDFFNENKYELVEDPQGICWDSEYGRLFQDLGIRVTTRESMYNSVHYVLRNNHTNPVTCELQVRTLADELWGEVSHVATYKNSNPSKITKEQIAILARLTTACSRLVDAIFLEE